MYQKICLILNYCRLKRSKKIFCLTQNEEYDTLYVTLHAKKHVEGVARRSPVHVFA